MKTLILVVSAGLLLASVPLHAGQSNRANAVPRANGKNLSGSIHVVFSTGDAETIRAHYASRFSSLPPGLQKKLARTGRLPPGWQKKIEPFPVALERRLTPLPAGYARGVFEGRAVIYVPGTSVTVDATVLF